MSTVPIEIASTLQSASLNRAPSPTHDINPTTSASAKEPVSISSSPQPPSSPTSSQSTIPLPDLKPIPRRQNLPPIPDLRFEQSYLASIKNAESRWDVAFVTVKDQVVMPFVQGMAWALLVQGWRHWNRGVKVRGQGFGGKVRRWWWGVNNWKIPEEGVR